LFDGRAARESQWKDVVDVKPLRPRVSEKEAVMEETTTRSRGVSLAKGPVWILGMLGVAYGVTGLIFGGHGFTTAQVPHGSISGTHWLGLLGNGWTNALFIAAGVLLLLSSPAHWGAKAGALFVAFGLGAAAVVAVIRGDGIFGLFAANGVTEVVWGAAAVILALLAVLPRVGGTSSVRTTPPVAPTQ
jgi:hypothetical protein